MNENVKLLNDDCLKAMKNIPDTSTKKKGKHF